MHLVVGYHNNSSQYRDTTQSSSKNPPSLSLPSFESEGLFCLVLLFPFLVFADSDLSELFPLVCLDFGEVASFED